MKTEIKAFKRAMESLKRASSKLDRKVERELQKEKTADELARLADLLPDGYRGTRRVYEVLHDKP